MGDKGDPLSSFLLQEGVIRLSLSPLVFDEEKLLRLASFFSSAPGTCLLYSGGAFDSSTASYLFLFPHKTVTIKASNTPWLQLERDLQLHEHFWVGFLSYEMGATCDSDKCINHQVPDYPLAHFQQSACVIIFDHHTRRAEVVIDPKVATNSKESKWLLKFMNEDFWQVFVLSLPPVQESKPASFKILKPFEDRLTFIEKVNRAKEWIFSGDLYQVNLSHESIIETTKDPFNCFYQLTQINPAPFSAFLNFGDFTIVSSSPERFLMKKGNKLETRPIKGTLPRGRSPQEDAIQLRKLISSEKERAELLMITDLMRNDLGKVSLPGTVETKALFKSEAYTNVFHLLSIIQSNPLPNLSSLQVIKACFPGGSITGCPKLNAMDAIYQLEQRSRGIYTGAIGFFQGNDFDFSIAIRTLVFQSGRVSIQLGSGIVADSIPENEYEETMHKGASIFSLFRNIP